MPGLARGRLGGGGDSSAGAHVGCGGGGGGGAPVGCGGGGGGAPVGCGGGRSVVPVPSGGGGENGATGRGIIRGKSFALMRMILFGFSEVMREEYNLKVVELGGTILQSIDYETATHIVVGADVWEGERLIWNREGKTVVSKDWIDQIYCQATQIQDNNDLVVTPNTNNDVSRPVSTNKRLRLCIGCSTRLVKRKLIYESAAEHANSVEEEILRKHHQLFLCPEDHSIWTSLLEFCLINKERLTTEIITPGTEKKHTYVVTSNDLKTRFKSCYELMNLHKAGLTLRGRFSSKSFVMDGYKNMRLSVLHRTVEKMKPGDKEIDTQRFVQIIKDEIFSHLKELPSDTEKWLKLVQRGLEAFDELVLQSIYLMEEHQSAATFKTLFNMFESMEGTDPQAYRNVKADLAQYKNWKSTVKRKGGNSYLFYTLNHINQATHKPTNYPDTIVGLLDLLRNTREHVARLKERFFILIVNYNFPSLMGDFQQAMYKEGYVVRHNTW